MIARVLGVIRASASKRSMVPVDSMDVTDVKKIKAVDGVGVSGIVDLRL